MANNTDFQNGFAAGYAARAKGAGSLEQVQADYHQNDETAADYIKNRPFYAGTETVVFTNDLANGSSVSTYESSSDSPSMQVIKNIGIRLAANETYQATATMKDGSTNDIAIRTFFCDNEDIDIGISPEEILESLIYSNGDFELPVSIERISGFTEALKNIKDNVVIFMDEDQTFMGFTCLSIDYDTFNVTYNPYVTTYGIMNSDIENISIVCEVIKPMPENLISKVIPDFYQTNPLAPDYIANMPIRAYSCFKFENEDEEPNIVYDSDSAYSDPGYLFVRNDRGIYVSENFSTPKRFSGYMDYYDRPEDEPLQLKINLKVPYNYGSTDNPSYSYYDAEIELGDLHYNNQDYATTDSGGSERYIEAYAGNLHLKDESAPDTGEDFLYYLWTFYYSGYTGPNVNQSLYIRQGATFEHYKNGEYEFEPYFKYMTDSSVPKEYRHISLVIGEPGVVYQPLPMEYMPSEIQEELEEIKDDIENIEDIKTDKSSAIKSIKTDNLVTYDNNSYPTWQALQEYESNPDARYVIHTSEGCFNPGSDIRHIDVRSCDTGYGQYNNGNYTSDYYNESSTNKGIGYPQLSRIIFEKDNNTNLTSIVFERSSYDKPSYLIDKVLTDPLGVPYTKKPVKPNDYYRYFYFLVPDQDGGSAGGEFYNSENLGDSIIYTSGDVYTALNTINIADFKSYAAEGANLTLVHNIPNTTETTTSGKNTTTTVTVPAATVTRSGSVVNYDNDVYAGNLSLKDGTAADTGEDFLIYWESATGYISFYLKSAAILDGTENTLSASNIAAKSSKTTLTSDLVQTAYTSKLVCYDYYNNAFTKVSLPSGFTIPRFKYGRIHYCDGIIYITGAQYLTPEGTWSSYRKLTALKLTYGTNSDGSTWVTDHTKIVSTEVISNNFYNCVYYSNGYENYYPFIVTKNRIYEQTYTGGIYGADVTYIDLSETSLGYPKHNSTIQPDVGELINNRDNIYESSNSIVYDKYLFVRTSNKLEIYDLDTENSLTLNVMNLVNRGIMDIIVDGTKIKIFYEACMEVYDATILQKLGEEDSSEETYEMTTVIDENSTDEQYPSSKAVYDFTQSAIQQAIQEALYVDEEDTV